MAAGDTMQGRRLPDGFHYRDAQPGDYWKQSHGGAIDDPATFAPDARGSEWDWCIRDPDGHMGTLGSHRIEEHDDGTITATPSILDPSTYTGDELRAMGVTSIISHDRANGWHGFLERGVWREV